MKMAVSSLNEVNLEKRLANVTNTQESIQTLSLWCLHHKAHFAKIVDIWMNVFSKAKITHQLALFYLANDVIQNSKRKGFIHFAEAWLPAIKSAMPMVRQDKIKSQIERILSIWEERNVFDTQSIMELRSICSNLKTEPLGGGGGDGGDMKFLADFKPQKLADKIKKFKKLEAEVELKHKQFTGLKLDVCSTETLKQLKDKAHGTKFTKEFDDATTKLDEFVQMLQRRGKERKALIELLEQSEAFYDTQRKEAKIVANAYKNFGARVKNLQAKLEELLPNLPTPVPSPTLNVPSPVDSKAAGAPAANQNKDNIEAVDMEMSDEDYAPVSGSGKNGDDADDDDDDAVSQSSAPSPDGSPVGLSASPNLRAHASSNSSAITPNTKVSSATSLLDNITSSGASAKSTASSLDIRLSNLMHSIPNFTSSFFGSSPVEGVKSAGVGNSKGGGAGGGGQRFTDILARNELGGTPLKDEEAAMGGSATPLQDETRETGYNLHLKPEGQAPNIISNLLQKLSSSSAAAQFNQNHLGSPVYREDSLSSHTKPSWLAKRELERSPLSTVGSLPQPPPSFVNFMPPPIARLSNPFNIDGITLSSLRSPSKATSGSNGMQSGLPSGKVAFFKNVERRNSNIVQLTPSPNMSPCPGLMDQRSDWNLTVAAASSVPDNCGEVGLGGGGDITALSSEDEGDFASGPNLTTAGFRPSLLNLPKRPTITINLRNTKAASSRETLAPPPPPPPPNNANMSSKFAADNNNDCTPMQKKMMMAASSSSNLRTIVPLNNAAADNGINEASSSSQHQKHDHGLCDTATTTTTTQQQEMYSKIEILESHRGESRDPWASLVNNADQLRRCEGAQFTVPANSATGWQQMIVPPLRNMRPRLPGSFGNSRGFRGGVRRAGGASAPRRDWRDPFGLRPKRPLLSPGVPPATWNYYPHEY